MHLMLTDRKQEAPDTTSFYFKPDHPFDWKAGQFLHYTLPHDFPDARKSDRYFTIASAPFENHIQLTTRFMADHGSTFKRALERMPLGGIVQADGPEGDFLVEDPTEEMIWIAGGVGITPFRAILLDLDHKKLPMPITLLYANRDNHFIFKDELEALAQEHPDFKLHYFISPQRIDEEAIRKFAPDIKKPVFYVSGPEPMVESYDKLLPSFGVPPHHVKSDYLPGYTWP
jgi:ferredoxin-NADP reductase